METETHAEIRWPNYEKSPYWTRIFIEIVLRALRQVHLNYLLLSAQQGKKDVKDNTDYFELNEAPGLAYADERFVCAEIYREFINTRYTLLTHNNVEAQSKNANGDNGDRSHDIKLGPRYLNNDGKIGDFEIKRIDDNVNKSLPEPRPVYIEAKRAFIQTFNNDSKTTDNRHKGGIPCDIQKLRYECTKDEEHRGYILVWHVTREDNKHQNLKICPEAYFKKLESDIGRPDIVVWQVRQCPLDIIKNEKTIEKPDIKQWLWVALAEVTEILENEKSPDNNHCS
jgi:hypothetical protein